MAFGDLTTLAAVKAWLKTGKDDPTSQDDGVLSSLITSASEWLKRYLNRGIVSQDWEELRDGVGTAQFVFAQFPVTAVLLVLVDGVNIPPVPPLNPPPPGLQQAQTFAYQAGYLFTATKLVIRGYIVPRKPLCVTLQYTAGFTAIPPDIAQACLELVIWSYKTRDRTAMTSQSLSGIEVAGFSLDALSKTTRQALDQFRAVAPVSSFSRQLAPTDIDAATAAAVLA